MGLGGGVTFEKGTTVREMDWGEGVWEKVNALLNEKYLNPAGRNRAD